MPKINRYILAGCLFFIAGISSAQQKNSNGPIRFHSINNVGLLEGETGSAFQLQTINGVGYKSWYGGLGLGLDYYRFRTIPFFLDLRKEFGKGSNKLFVYVDLGTNICWLTDNQKTTYLVNDQFEKGLYSDLGLGYKIAIGKTDALQLSLGYSYKKITETYQTYNTYFPTDLFTEPTGNPPTERIQYGLKRLSIKIGWEF